MKNFLDTQTGGASDVNPENTDELSKTTDLSPRQISQIQKSTDDTSPDVKVQPQAEEVPNSVQSVEEGKTSQETQGIEAGNSAAANILQEYDEEKGIQTSETEADQADNIYSNILSFSGLSKEDVDTEDEEDFSLIPKPQKLFYINENGEKTEIQEPVGPLGDKEIEKMFPVDIKGEPVMSTESLDRGLILQQNSRVGDEEQLVNLDGIPIDRDLLPESERNFLQGKVSEGEDPEEPKERKKNAYYKLKGNVYYKDSNGKWFSLRERKSQPFGARFEKKIRDVKPVNARISRALEDNSSYLIDKKFANEKALDLLYSGEAASRKLKDIGREDVYGNVITLQDYIEEAEKEEERAKDWITQSRDDLPEVTAQRYKLFNYDGEAISDLEGRMRKKIAKERGVEESEISAQSIGNQLKPDGEYRVGAKKYVKDNGKWYRLVRSNKYKEEEGTSEALNPIVDGYRKAKRLIKGGIVAKEIKYDDVVGLEVNSTNVNNMSKKYVRWSISTAIEEFEDNAVIALNNIKNKAQSGVEYLLETRSEKLAKEKGNPVLDMLESQVSELGLKLNKFGFTTKDIQRAQLDLRASFGDILNDEMEEMMVQFDLSTESLFYPNVYGLDAARERIEKTFFPSYDAITGERKEQPTGPFGPITYPLSDAEVIQYRGLGYLSENNTFSIPKKAGVYFAMNETEDLGYTSVVDVSRATKYYNGDGTYSWYDESGSLITDPRVQAMYESSQVTNDDVVEAYSTEEHNLIEASMYQDDGETMSIIDGEFDPKKSSLRNLVFSDDDFASFLSEPGSPVYGDPYFSSMAAVYLLGNSEPIKISDYMSLITGSSELTQENFDKTISAEFAFSQKLSDAISQYNEYKDSQSSLMFFVENIQDIKYRTQGANEESFDGALDGYANAALEILTSDVSTSRRIEMANNLKQEISIWKENINITTEKVDEIRRSGLSVDRYMFNKRESVINSLYNIGNDRYLEAAVEMYNTNKEILRIMDSESLGDGELGVYSKEYSDAIDGKLYALSANIDKLTGFEATSSLDEQAKLNSKLHNLNEAIPMLRDLLEGKVDYRLGAAEDFELDEDQKTTLALDLLYLEKTKEKVLGQIEQLDVQTNAFFKVDAKKAFESVAEISPETIKPFISSIPSGEQFSAKNKFDFLFMQMNDRRLKLEQELNLSGQSFSSRMEVTGDKLKAMFSGLSPKEKEYYSLVYQIRNMTPLFLNNKQALAEEEDGFFREFMGAAIGFMYDEDMMYAAGEHLGVDVGDTKHRIRNFAETLDKMNQEVMGGLELEESAKKNLDDLITYGISEDSMGSADFWGSTVGVTAAIVTMFTGTGFAYTKLFKGITGAEKLLRKGRKGKKIAESIIEKGVTDYYTKYQSLMSKNRFLKHVVGPSLEMGARFKATGLPFNQNVQEELTFLAGAAGGVLSQAYLKGVPFLGRKVSGMTKEQYANFMKSVFGEKTIEALKFISTPMGHGTAETLQETGEELTHIWERSKNGQEFWKELDLQFGESSQRLKFVVSTFVMGAFFGLGSKSQMQSAYAALNKEERQKYNLIKEQLKTQHETILSEAEKSRERTMQNATDVANATTKEETRKDDSKDQTRVPGEEQVGEESVEAKPVEEKSKEETGSDRVLQEKADKELKDKHGDFNKLEVTEFDHEKDYLDQVKSGKRGKPKKTITVTDENGRRGELEFTRVDAKTGEPTSIAAEDGWAYLRLSNGMYTDGDQIYENFDALLGSLASGDFQVITTGGLSGEMSPAKEQQRRNGEAIKKMEQEIKDGTFDEKNSKFVNSENKEVGSKINNNEEILDPYRKNINQKRKRNNWNTESKSDEIIDDLQKRGENDEFVEGTTESNALEVFNTLTAEQQNEVRNMSQRGNLIKPYLVYQKIFSLGKSNAESKILDQKVDELVNDEKIESIFDPADELKAIQGYEQTLEQENNEAQKLIKEESAIEEGVDPEIEAEMEQTILAENQGDVVLRDEQGNVIDKDRVQMEEEVQDNYNYNNLDESNKEVLRQKAKQELIEEERQRRRRNRRINKRRGEFKGEKMSKKDRKNKMDLTPRPITEEAIEQRAEEMYNAMQQQRANQTLGVRTPEIESERTNLTYNQNKSEDSGNIVYDINDESGAIGEVSGRFNSDGDFVIEGIAVNKSSGDFDLEAIDAIAENVKGDIILPGDSDIGKRLYDDDVALIDANGNYLIPNTDTSITEDQGEIRAGDRLRRQLRRVAVEGGITMNSGPAETAYNLAVEAAAKILDAGGSIVKSAVAARKAYRNSNFYKKLKAEEQRESLNRLDAALRDAMNTEELIQYDESATKSINQAVKTWQDNSSVWQNASRSEKARLTKEFKRDLQEDIDAAFEAKQQAKQQENQEEVSTEESASDVDKRLEEATEKVKNEKVEEKSPRKRRRAIQDKIDASKEKVNQTKEGMKILNDLKNELSQYAKDNLPKTNYSKADVNKILNTISKVKNHNQLSKAFLELDNLIAKKGGQELAAKRKSTKSRISPRNLRKEFFKVKDSKKTAKMGYDSVQEIQDYIAQMGGMEAVAEMDIEQLNEFNDVLDGLISTGKSDFKAAQRFIRDQRRRAQASIIQGFGDLNTDMDVTNRMVDVNSIREHLSIRGNYILLNGKYYNKTDFSVFEADNIRALKETSQYKEASSDQQSEMIENLKDNMINLEDISDDLNLSDPSDFKAYEKDVRINRGLKDYLSKINNYANPVNAAMDVYGLINKAFSGGLGRKGNNQLKDFLQKNIGEKMPIAFARTQQQVYEIQQEHRAKLEEIFGKNNFRKVTNTGEKFINAIAGGYTTMPAVLSKQVDGLVSSTTGEPIVSPFRNQNNQKVKPTNDQLVNVYNIARSSKTQRDRLVKQGVDVDAIKQYIESNSSLSDYADYLVDFYKNKGRDLYEGAYQKYTKGSGFEIGKDGDEFYYPISSAENVSTKSSEQSIMDMIANEDFNGVAMAINPDAFKERTNQGEIDITKSATETFAKYNTQNSRYSNFADIVSSLQTLFGNEAAVNLMKRNMGEGAYAKLVTALSDSIAGEITGRSKPGDMSMKAVSIFNTFGVIGTLWGKPQQIFKQATSFTHFWNAGLKYGLQGEMPGWHAGLTGVAKRKPFAAMYGAMTSQEIRDFEMAVLKSGFIQERWQGGGSSLDLDLKKAREAMNQSGKSSLFDWFISKPANIGLLTTRMGDMAGVLFGPGGGMTFAVNMYNKYKSEGMSHEEATKRAIEVFQVEATQAQQTTQIDNYSTASKNVLFRLAGQYRTSQGAAARKTLRAVKLLTSRTKLNKKEKAQAVSDLIYFGILSPITFTAVSGGQLALVSSMFAGTMPVADGEDEDEVRERMKSDWAFDTVQSLMQGYAWSGYIADALMNEIRGREYYNNVPVIKTLQNVVDAAVTSGTEREKMIASGKDQNIFDMIGLSSKNYDQLADLYDLFQKDKVFTEEFARTLLNWDEVYMDKAAFRNYQQTPKDTQFYTQDKSFELWQQIWGDEKPAGGGTGKGLELFGIEVIEPGYKAYKEGVRPPDESKVKKLEEGQQVEEGKTTSQGRGMSSGRTLGN